jgi:hypothetical protein
MRPLSFAGTMVIGLGSIVLLHGGRYTAPRDMDGPASIARAAGEPRFIAPWVGGLAMLSGLGLVAAGARKSPPSAR